MHFSLRCHLCQAGYPAEALWVCSKCLGPLEVVYDYDAIAKLMSREGIERRPKNLWRYRELLPVQGDPRTGRDLARRVASAADADYLLRIDSSALTTEPFIRLPRTGPVLACRPLDASPPPSLPDFALTMGDIELF